MYTVRAAMSTSGETFGVAPLTWDDWTYVLRFAVPILLVEEVLKVKKMVEVREGMKSLCPLNTLIVLFPSARESITGHFDSLLLTPPPTPSHHLILDR